MNNPINSHSGKICKNSRGLRIHQEKTKCQTPENKLVAPPQKRFVYLCKKGLCKICSTREEENVSENTGKEYKITQINAFQSILNNLLHHTLNVVELIPLLKVTNSRDIYRYTMQRHYISTAGTLKNGRNRTSDH